MMKAKPLIREHQQQPFYYCYIATLNLAHLGHSLPRQTHRRGHCRPGHRTCPPARSWHSLDYSTTLPQDPLNHLQTATPVHHLHRARHRRRRPQTDRFPRLLSEKRFILSEKCAYLHGRNDKDCISFTEAVSSVPVTGRVVASFVTVAIFDPGSWAALSTVGDRPGEIHLQASKESKSQIFLN